MATPTATHLVSLVRMHCFVFSLRFSMIISIMMHATAIISCFHFREVKKFCFMTALRKLVIYSITDTISLFMKNYVLNYEANFSRSLGILTLWNRWDRSGSIGNLVFSSICKYYSLDKGIKSTLHVSVCSKWERTKTSIGWSRFKIFASHFPKTLKFWWKTSPSSSLKGVFE